MQRNVNASETKTKMMIKKVKIAKQIKEENKEEPPPDEHLTDNDNDMKACQNVKN